MTRLLVYYKQAYPRVLLLLGKIQCDFINTGNIK